MACEHCKKKKVFASRQPIDQEKCRCKIDWLVSTRLFVNWCVSNGLELSSPIDYSTLAIDALAPDVLNTNVSVEYAINRKSTIKPDLDHISSIIHKYAFDSDDDSYYLDIGCGNMLKTRLVAQELGVIAYGTDFEDRRLSEKKKDCFQHIRSKGKLCFKDDSFLVISCLNFLHHTKSPSSIIDEMFRVLRPGGILILQEMECESFTDCYYLDYYHYSLSKLIPGCQPIGSYRSSHGWREMIEASGLISTGVIHQSFQEQDSIPMNYKVYFEVFEKPKTEDEEDEYSSSNDYEEDSGDEYFPLSEDDET